MGVKQTITATLVACFFFAGGGRLPLRAEGTSGVAPAMNREQVEDGIVSEANGTRGAAPMVLFDRGFGLNRFFDDTFGWVLAQPAKTNTYIDRPARHYRAGKPIERSSSATTLLPDETEVTNGVSLASLQETSAATSRGPERQDDTAELGTTMPMNETPCPHESCREVRCDSIPVVPWRHRCSVFGESLFLRARNAEVAYAIP